jgi:hypothetical protein
MFRSARGGVGGAHSGEAILLVQHEKGSGTEEAAHAKRTVVRGQADRGKASEQMSSARDEAKMIASRPTKV